MADPARDCPACPACQMELATPIRESGQDRWDGPQDATLFCPSCGSGWFGTVDDLLRARKSWAAYEEELAEDRDAGDRKGGDLSELAGNWPREFPR